MKQICQIIVLHMFQLHHGYDSYHARHEESGMLLLTQPALYALWLKYQIVKMGNTSTLQAYHIEQFTQHSYLLSYA